MLLLTTFRRWRRRRRWRRWRRLSRGRWRRRRRLRHGRWRGGGAIGRRRSTSAHLHADPSVIVTARDVVDGRVEIVDVAGDAARRILVLNRLFTPTAKPKALIPERRGPSAAERPCRSATSITLSALDSIACFRHSGRSAWRRSHAIPVEDADRLPFREAPGRAALLGAFATDHLRPRSPSARSRR